MTRPVIVVAGSRCLTDPRQVIEAFREATDRLPDRLLRQGGVTFLHGGARGVDAIVGEWLCRNVNAADVEVMPADWDRHGRKAGHIRNDAMVKRAQDTSGALVAVWDGSSRGTAGAIGAAARRRVPAFVEIAYPPLHR